MDKITKNIINKTIERGYYSVTDDFGGVMKKNKEWGKEHNEYSYKIEELADKLKEVVPDEYRDLVEELVDITMCFTCIEGKILFKEGVVLGITELNYLGEVGAQLSFI
ncbi:MAG: hypothetical protein F8N39_18140 [Clostridiaceae bacterium]|nr:hypothetical protein [Clostridiaceae bacterium]